MKFRLVEELDIKIPLWKLPNFTLADGTIYSFRPYDDKYIVSTDEMGSTVQVLGSNLKPIKLRNKSYDIFFKDGITHTSVDLDKIIYGTKLYLERNPGDTLSNRGGDGGRNSKLANIENTLAADAYTDVRNEYLAAQKFEQTDEFKKLMQEYPDYYQIRNTEDPRNILHGEDTYYNFRCSKCGNVWKAQLNSRTSTNHRGCPDCAHYVRVSKTEKLIFDKVKEKYSDAVNSNFDTIYYMRGKNNNIKQYMELDIYIPSKKIAIEVDDAYTHNPMSDNRKNILCQKAGIKLFRIKAVQGYSEEPKIINNNCYLIQYRKNNNTEFNKAMELLLKNI